MTRQSIVVAAYAALIIVIVWALLSLAAIRFG